jgi:hypothetical protein
MSPSSSLYLGYGASVHDHLKKLGVTLAAANSRDHFLEDSPTAASWLIVKVNGTLISRHHGL